MIELESLAEFDAWIAEHGALHNVALQGLDLTGRTEVLQQVRFDGAFFLGCRLSPDGAAAITDGGAIVFPPFPDLPFQAFRPRLYRPEELYEHYVPGDAASYDLTVDGRTYRWHRQVVETLNVVGTLAQRVHDHAIDDALFAQLDEIGPDRVVAIMGGHSMRRDAPEYRQVAVLGRALTRAGFYVATGGGPGAMEAANFGAWMSGHDDDALDAALAMLAPAPHYTPVGKWLDAAFAVRARWPLPTDGPNSLGVPTWHYGHEPPNVFASEIAKYFANAIREDGLLAIALAGVVFAPGSAGTIQEVFQDAAQNHYESFGPASPMVFLDVDYWTGTKPVYPLLKGLAEGHAYADGLTAFDDVDSVIAWLEERHAVRAAEVAAAVAATGAAP